MASMKLGSKPDGIQRKDRDWFCHTGLPSDIVVEVEDISFHLHKFPLVTKSGKLAQLIEDHNEKQEDILRLKLPDLPGGSSAFEFVVKFCYGFRFELTPTNVVPIRCAAQYLEMSEDLGEGNLIACTEGFLNQIVLRNWKECVLVLCSCEAVYSEAEELGIVNMCIDAITVKACTDPSLLGCPAPSTAMQSPGGGFLWNGISTGARPKKLRSDWWYEDVSLLSLPLFKRVILAMQKRGIKTENIAGALMHFAKKYLPALNKRQITKDGTGRIGSLPLSSVPSENEQKLILETIECLLPIQKGTVPTKFLSGLLRSAIILNACSDCRENIERRIGIQLDQASLEDLLIPSLAYNLETLYDIDCVQRILKNFLIYDQSTANMSALSSDDDEHTMNSPSLTPMMTVARLMDAYLAEIAPDVNLKPSKFQSLAEALPDFARVSDDGLYRAIDIFLKEHSWLKEEERERICRVMDCQKLSLEACAHAAQNDRLPLRVIVQVLFFEQLQLRTAIASCFMVSDNSRPFVSQPGHDAAHPAAAVRGEGGNYALRGNHDLKRDVDIMNLRVNDLQNECNVIRVELEKLGKFRGSASKTLGGRFRTHICRTKHSAVEDQSQTSGSSQDHHQTRTSKNRRRNSSLV